MLRKEDSQGNTDSILDDLISSKLTVEDFEIKLRENPSYFFDANVAIPSTKKRGKPQQMSLTEYFIRSNKIDYLQAIVNEYLNSNLGSKVAEDFKSDESFEGARNRVTQFLNQQLFIALDSSNAEAVLFLLKMGADPNSKGEDHTSALAFAVKQNNLGICKLLVRSGAQVEEQQWSDKSPLVLALALDRRDIAEFLFSSIKDKLSQLSKDGALVRLHNKVCSYLESRSYIDFLFSAREKYQSSFMYGNIFKKYEKLARKPENPSREKANLNQRQSGGSKK